VNDLFGHPYDIPERVQKIVDDHKKFFEDNAVLGVGQVLYVSLPKEPVVKRIDQEALKKAWKAFPKSDGFAEVSQKLAVEGYRDGVPIPQRRPQGVGAEVL
jgi:hypothetical protein